MSTDPLTADRRSLVVQAEHVISQLADERSWPFLRRIGSDPVDMLTRLRTSTAQAREVLAAATNGARQLKALRQRAAAAVQKVAPWQVSVRAALQAVPPSEVGRVVVRELRGIVALPPLRLPSTIRMLREAFDRLQDHAPVLRGVDVPPLAGAAELLIAELDAHRERIDAALAAHIQASTRATATVAGLRQILREVRGAWRFARSMSAGVMLELDLSIGAAAIQQRADVAGREATEDDSGREENDSEGEENDSGREENDSSPEEDDS